MTRWTPYKIGVRSRRFQALCLLRACQESFGILEDLDADPAVLPGLPNLSWMSCPCEHDDSWDLQGLAETEHAVAPDLGNIHSFGRCEQSRRLIK